MVKTHTLGFPRIGANRELKYALESFWEGKSSYQSLERIAAELRQRHWSHQSQLDMVPAGDFSLYDNVLDMSVTLGNIPQRIRALGGTELDICFRLARGRAQTGNSGSAVNPGEMTKWFDTNYHYIVPEFDAQTSFKLHPNRLISQIAEARQLGHVPKPVVIGPVTYLWLGKVKDGTDKRDLLDRILPVYAQLLDLLAELDVAWIQIDEPLLTMEIDSFWKQAFNLAYRRFSGKPVKLLLTTYFGQLQENIELVGDLPVHGLHLDAIGADHEIQDVLNRIPADRVLSLGVINGRNIWKTDLNMVLNLLEPIHRAIGDRLWLAPSCSLIHVPLDLDSENNLDPELRSWLAFARQKVKALEILATALNHGRQSVTAELAENREAINSRQRSPQVHDSAVQAAAGAISSKMEKRRSAYPERAAIQRLRLNLPVLPTTTIGSFPQTAQIRRIRREFRLGALSADAYHALMRNEIDRCMREQEETGLDILVHGEAERNDMVEYFAEQLEGFAVTQCGWVQSYGSRCVKPPVIYGDVSRSRPMTLEWSRYAKSRSEKPLKGMLTGPVTLLNWSFVRDDQPRSATCTQIALAIRAEVLDLEQAKIDIIQIDEPALREGLPQRAAQWHDYLGWAVKCFRIAANGVKDGTQIHTHMCYSVFNDIIRSIAELDADVITIEASRSNMALLDAFDEFSYPNEIGPGVYDIHSPNIPTVEQMVRLIRSASEKIPVARLWVNPDCGLKTRDWREVKPSLKNMVQAAAIVRRQFHREHNKLAAD